MKTEQEYKIERLEEEVDFLQSMITDYQSIVRSKEQPTTTLCLGCLDTITSEFTPPITTIRLLNRLNWLV